jgi:hypothetical protein
MDVLVMGATGNVGGALVDLLRARHVRVLAISREARTWPDGVEGVVGDANDPASLAGAAAGMDGAFLMSGYAAEGQLLADSTSRRSSRRLSRFSAGGRCVCAAGLSATARVSSEAQYAVPVAVQKAGCTVHPRRRGLVALVGLIQREDVRSDGIQHCAPLHSFNDEQCTPAGGRPPRAERTSRRRSRSTTAPSAPSVEGFNPGGSASQYLTISGHRDRRMVSQFVDRSREGLRLAGAPRARPGRGPARPLRR